MNRIDFSDQRVLMVGTKIHTIQLLRSVMGIAGVSKLVHVKDSRSAIELLSVEHFTAVFATDCVADYDGQPFAIAARRKESVLNRMIPIFVVRERARRRDVERDRDSGVTDVLTTPISPKTIITKLKTAVIAPRPFVIANEFFGPDRRANTQAPFHGSDRRTRTPKKAKVDFNQL